MTEIDRNGSRQIESNAFELAIVMLCEMNSSFKRTYLYVNFFNHIFFYFINFSSHYSVFIGLIHSVCDAVAQATVSRASGCGRSIRQKKHRERESA